MPNHPQIPSMQQTILPIFLLLTHFTFAQIDLKKPLENCQVTGSSTLYDYQHKQWIFSDSIDALTLTQPASTFKIINLLIALETKVIRDENSTVKWVGSTDTTLYGYRPDIYKDMTVKEAFELSAGWVFIELAKKIGKKRYLDYLQRCGYGNLNLSEPGDDFWNFGPFGISPKNQVEFLIKVHEGKVPFSKRNLKILQAVMINEVKPTYTLRAKTGWTRVEGRDIGWWVGYVTRKDNVYFFATRLTKARAQANPNFGQCRKEITRHVLQQIQAIE